MFKIKYLNSEVKEILTHLDLCFTQEEQKSIKNLLEQLKSSGEVRNTFEVLHTFHPNIDMTEGVWEVRTQEFAVTFSVDSDKKIVKILTFQIRPIYAENEWINYLNSEQLEDEDEQPLYITQVDKPEDVIRAVKLISQGKNSAWSLGKALGHKGKEKSISRHGSYKGRTVTELKLANAQKQGRSYIYTLTELGQRIAFSENSELETRLMAEAMLGYKPIQFMLGEIQQEKPFDLEFVQNAIKHHLCPHDHTDTTAKRRAQALRTWTIWICHIMGIPIVYKGSQGKQLYIPYIYASQNV